MKATFFISIIAATVTLVNADPVGISLPEPECPAGPTSCADIIGMSGECYNLNGGDVECSEKAICECPEGCHLVEAPDPAIYPGGACVVIE
ncbi:hypothetical protein SNK04_004263 [Fusarium graminearum]